MPPELVFKTAAQEVIDEGLHQLFQADVVPTLARPFGIFSEAHVQIPGDFCIVSVLVLVARAYSTVKGDEFLETNFINRVACSAGRPPALRSDEEQGGGFRQSPKPSNNRRRGGIEKTRARMVWRGRERRRRNAQAHPG